LIPGIATVAEFEDEARADEEGYGAVEGGVSGAAGRAPARVADAFIEDDAFEGIEDMLLCGGEGGDDARILGRRAGQLDHAGVGNGL